MQGSDVVCDSILLMFWNWIFVEASANVSGKIEIANSVEQI